MPLKPIRLVCLSCCLWLAAVALAQEGHPAKGTWVGDWGPTAAQRNHVVVVMDWDGKNITGVVNPGPNAVPMKMARLDITPGSPSPQRGTPAVVPGFKLHIEAETKDTKGNTISIVADGTMLEVALPNRLITGTWSQTSGGTTVKGDFKISRQ